MKESISYTFVLNIVIMFIFICAAVIMGIFSYFRAYKANTIIINEIEKYEGYNCLSAQTIAQKLSTISYNVNLASFKKSSKFINYNQVIVDVVTNFISLNYYEYLNSLLKNIKKEISFLKLTTLSTI